MPRVDDISLVLGEMTTISFEQGPIRPPSEAQSLLLRFTRNCNWNQCLFCPVYKGRTFSRRNKEEIKADIDGAAEIVQQVQSVSWKLGFSGQVGDAVARYFFDQDLPQSFLSVVAWLYHGTGAVFLQDANNLLLPTGQLVELLEYLHHKIKGITRITSYARSRTLQRKSTDELKRIRGSGLNRIHVGFESGCDAVLKFMKKGATAEAHIEAGLKVKEAGMELSEYYMPGLGGLEMWRDHAVDSARALSRINPDFIRFRTLRVPERIPLYEHMVRGDFKRMSDDEVVEEIRVFVENLEGIESYVSSDHIMNLLQDVEGRLPRDKNRMLQSIERYLALDPEQRLRYRLGRRMGWFRGVGDMNSPGMSDRVDQSLHQISSRYPGHSLEQLLEELANRMI